MSQWIFAPTKRGLFLLNLHNKCCVLSDKFGGVGYLQGTEYLVQYNCGWQGALKSGKQRAKSQPDLADAPPRERRKMEGKRKARAKYRPEYPSLMYRYFRGYSDQGAPSYLKFAESLGATCEDIRLWRCHKRFDRSYRECSEIRRDYLIDNALTRRFDPSFVKYLLGLEFPDECGNDGEMSVHVEVVE